MTPGPFSGRTIRARLLVASLLAVATALLAGGVLLYAILTTSLRHSVQVGAQSIARDVAALVDAGRLPDPVPVSGAQVVQVIDATGRVVGGSVTADRLTPLVTDDERRAAVAGETVVVPGNRTGLSGALQVAAVETGPSGARVTVVAAAPTADVEASGRTLRTLLLVLFPLLLGALAAITWRVVGAALRPVEALRLGAARIDEASAETERLPVPPARDEISALATTLNAMLDRVAAARRTQRAFVADAAHELRSPLASMRTQVEVAQRMGEGGRLPEDLLADVARLSALVEDLLLLARADDATRDPARSPIDLRPLLERVVGRYAAVRVPVRLEAAADSSGASAGAGLTAVADPRDLERALTNLLDNAVRHAGTAVTVAALRSGARVEVHVVDDGHGIPESERERVFDRFTRLDEGRDRDSGGAGLGLAITRELLRRGGATVRLDDADPGVRAVVTFPSD